MENKLSRMDVLRGAAEAIRNTLGSSRRIALPPNSDAPFML